MTPALFLMRGMKLTISATIRWEKLTGNSFSMMDFSSEDDLLQLLYCCTPESELNCATYDEYKRAVSVAPKALKKAIESLSVYQSYVAQFQKEIKESNPKEADSESPKMSEVAARLIITGGMDASFVLNELPVEDIGFYVKELGEKIKHEEESRRLWTYLSMIPHLSKEAIRGKMRSPQTFHPFPWEAEELAERSRRNIEQNKDTFEKFMRGELFDPNQFSWKPKK